MKRRLTYRKPKYILLRMSLIGVLVGLFFWSYLLFSQNYERVELSQKMVSALLDNETELAREYAEKLGLTEKNLERTELFLADMRMENLKLKEKIKLLDQLNEMERQIALLKDENVQIKEQMMTVSLLKESLEKNQGSGTIGSIDEGKGMIVKFKQKIREIKNQISSLKFKEHQNKVAIQQAIDKERSLLGNNGYIIKDGKPMPMSLPEATARNVKVNVEFVK